VIYGGQWGDGLTQAQKAWDITTGSSKVIVAVVDSGIDDAHPDLAGQVVPGASMVGGSTVDTSGHGEYVAGVIAPDTNNGVGVAGYCWTCRLMPIKITDSGSATYSAMASGIVWATDHGARVINVSYAGTTRSSTIDSAVSYATDRGALVVAAAGNSGCDCVTYPAGSPGAIAVAASDQHDNLMTYSNRGSWVQVAAPTGDITTWLTFNGQSYAYAPVGGTSISAPVVSGILALMLSFDPKATLPQLENALFSSVDPITGVDQGGARAIVQYGRVDAYKALVAMGATTGPAPSPTPSPTPSPSPVASPSPSLSPTSSSPAPGPTSSSSSIPPSSSSSTPPAPQVFTFSGSINQRNPSKTFPLTLPVGAVEAQLAFKRCPSLELAMADAGNAPVGEREGPSVVTLDTNVPAGSYAYTVSGGKCSFTLTVTVVPQSG
jgi:subtilisin family serine protease